MEDRNDLLVQKMKRYINAFSKDGVPAKEREETGKNDPGNDPQQISFTVENRPKIQRKPKKCWELIRQSIECEKEENVDCLDTNYI